MSEESLSKKGRGKRYTAIQIEKAESGLLDYLEALDIDVSDGGNFLCPIHNDTRPSASVYGDRVHRWTCHACCLHGNAFDLSRHLRRSTSFPEAVRDVARAIGLNLETLESCASITTPLERKESLAPPEPENTAWGKDEEILRWCVSFNFRDEFSRWAVEEFAEELKIPIWVLEKLMGGDSCLGVHEGQLAYVYPQGIKLRCKPGSRTRFRWVAGKAHAPWRFELVTAETTTIYLTEGETDVLALIAAGIENLPESVVVASPGVSFPRSWAPLFKGKDVIICFDFDAPGQGGAQKVARLLTAHGARVKIAKFRSKEKESNSVSK